MPIACETCGRPAASAEGTGSRLLATLARIGAAFRERRRDSRQLARLLDLDDHLLADIGITRDEVRFRLGRVARARTGGTEASRLHPRGSSLRA